MINSSLFKTLTSFRMYCPRMISKYKWWSTDTLLNPVPMNLPTAVFEHMAAGFVNSSLIWPNYGRQQHVQILTYNLKYELSMSTSIGTSAIASLDDSFLISLNIFLPSLCTKKHQKVGGISWKIMMILLVMFSIGETDLNVCEI